MFGASLREERQEGSVQDPQGTGSLSEDGGCRSMSSPGFSDPDGLDDPSAEAEEAEEAEEEVSLEATLPGAISQAERYRRPPRLA